MNARILLVLIMLMSYAIPCYGTYVSGLIYNYGVMNSKTAGNGDGLVYAYPEGAPSYCTPDSNDGLVLEAYSGNSSSKTTKYIYADKITYPELTLNSNHNYKYCVYNWKSKTYRLCNYSYSMPSDYSGRQDIVTSLSINLFGRQIDSEYSFNRTIDGGMQISDPSSLVACGIPITGTSRSSNSDTSKYYFTTDCSGSNRLNKIRLTADSASIKSRTSPDGTSFLINGVSPSIVTTRQIWHPDGADYYDWNGSLEWQIKVSKGCGEQVTLEPNVPTDGSVGAVITSILAEYCNEVMQSFTVSPGTIHPLLGEAATLAGTMNRDASWQLNVKSPSGSIVYSASGSGSTISASWNGEGAVQGNYVATLSATASDGCTDERTANISVVTCEDNDGDGYYAYGPNCPKGNDCDDNNPVIHPGATEKCGDGIDNNCNGKVDEECGEDPCDQANAPSGSKANVISGALYHSQPLFSTELVLDLNLHYNSLNLTDGPLGPGWSHGFQVSLQDNVTSVSVREGNGNIRTFSLSGGVYSAQAGDYGKLTKTAQSTFHLVEPDGTGKTFASDGKIVTTSDRFGNTLTLAYEGGDLVSVHDDFGRTVTFFYDTASTPHRLTSVVPPNGASYDFDHLNGRLWRVSNPPAVLGDVRGYWEYTYSQKGLMETKRDPQGHTFQYSYYSDGRLQSAIDPEGATAPTGHTRTYLYPTLWNDSTLTSTFTEKSGNSWLYAFDPATNKLRSKTDPNGKATSYTHYSNGNIKSMTVPVSGTKRVTTFYTYFYFVTLKKAG